MGMLSALLADATGSINQGANAACAGACNTGATVGSIFHSLANVLIFVAGAISVIMIIIGGIRYATSNGDSKATTAAKDTILYAVIGVVVAIASFAIVNFVTKNIK
jgi:cytochrome bd-type quinol oxidase subunit 2